MKHKFCTVLLLFVVLLSCLTVSAFAEDTTNPGDFNWDAGRGFIENLFVPPDDYFMKQNSLLNEKVKLKMGGLGTLYQMIEAFFSTMQNGKAYAFKATIPDNAFIQGSKGFTIDYMEPVSPLISIIHGILTAAVCIFTVIVCYHKIRKLFDT